MVKIKIYLTRQPPFMMSVILDRLRYWQENTGLGIPDFLMHMSDISQVFEVDDIFTFWMHISGLNQCIMKKA
jgi:hypothetical protein